MKGKVLSVVLSIVTASTFGFYGPVSAELPTRDLTVNGIKFTNVPAGKIPMTMAELKKELEGCRERHRGDPAGTDACQFYLNKAKVDLGYALISGKEPSSVILRDMTPDEIKAENALPAAGGPIVPLEMPDVLPGMNLSF